MLQIAIAISFRILMVIMSTPMSRADFHGPHGMNKNDSVSCEEYGKFARFNPYSVLDDHWIVFFYWAPFNRRFIYKFEVPTKEQLDKIKPHIAEYYKEAINWTAKSVLMSDDHNVTSLLVEQDDRGKYFTYVINSELKKGVVYEPDELRFKQTGDNKYIGYMLCYDEMVFVMSRTWDIPKQTELYDEAVKLGYKGRGGKSYLYQGNHWMPIGDLPEHEYFLENEYKRRI